MILQAAKEHCKRTNTSYKRGPICAGVHIHFTHHCMFANPNCKKKKKKPLFAEVDMAYSSRTIATPGLRLILNRTCPTRSLIESC